MVAVSLKKKIFFKQKTAYEMIEGDWSSDVCSSISPVQSETTLNGLFLVISLLPIAGGLIRLAILKFYTYDEKAYHADLRILEERRARLASATQ